MEASLLLEAKEEALKDPVRHYFILLTLFKEPNAFASLEKFGNLWAFFRQTGNVQVMCGNGKQHFEEGALEALVLKLNETPYKSVICTTFIAEALMRSGLKANLRYGGVMAFCDPMAFIDKESQFDPEPLEALDLDAVETLYKKVFEGFAKKDYMQEKLSSSRGRGFLIKTKAQVISISQSDFETPESAVIVGVATDPLYGGKGYAKACMLSLCRALIAEGKTLGLIYENEQAGRLYEALGFVPKDRLCHLERK